MTTEEKVLFEGLIEKSNKFTSSEINAKADEMSDESLKEEMKQGIELLSYALDTLERKGTPSIFKKWLKRLWHHVRIAIANWVREIACAIDPLCKN